MFEDVIIYYLCLSTGHSWALIGKKWELFEIQVMFVICALRDKGDCEWHQSTFPSAGILKKAYTTLNPITIIKLTGLFSTDWSCYFKVCLKQWIFTFFSHKVSYFTNVRGISLKIGNWIFQTVYICDQGPFIYKLDFEMWC